MRQPTILIASVAAVVIGTAALPAAAASSKKSQKALCKQIHDAIAAGQTLDQITRDLNTDEQQVMKCTQKPGRRRAPKSPKKARSQPAAKPEAHTSSTTEKPKSSTPPRTSRPLRRRPIP
jgi:hypothetical protein